MTSYGKLLRNIKSNDLMFINDPGYERGGGGGVEYGKEAFS